MYLVLRLCGFTWLTRDFSSTISTSWGLYSFLVLRFTFLCVFLLTHCNITYIPVSQGQEDGARHEWRCLNALNTMNVDTARSPRADFLTRPWVQPRALLLGNTTQCYCSQLRHTKLDYQEVTRNTMKPCRRLQIMTVVRQSPEPLYYTILYRIRVIVFFWELFSSCDLSHAAEVIRRKQEEIAWKLHPCRISINVQVAWRWYHYGCGGQIWGKEPTWKT